MQSLHEMVIYTAVEAETKFINMYSYKLIKTRVVTKFVFIFTIFFRVNPVYSKYLTQGDKKTLRALEHPE